MTLSVSNEVRCSAFKQLLTFKPSVSPRKEMTPDTCGGAALLSVRRGAFVFVTAVTDEGSGKKQAFPCLVEKKRRDSAA